MHDEEAAIAAAIAASLAEAENNDQKSSDNDYSDDCDSSGSSDEILSTGSMAGEGTTSAEQASSGSEETATPSEGSSEIGSLSTDISTRLDETRRAVSMPVPIPSHAQHPSPSSIVDRISYALLHRAHGLSFSLQH